MVTREKFVLSLQFSLRTETPFWIRLTSGESELGLLVYMEEQFGTISRDDLKQKIDRGDRFYLVETLAENAYQHAHLPNAINIPPDRINELAPKLLPDRNAEIIVYCASPT